MSVYREVLNGNPDNFIKKFIQGTSDIYSTICIMYLVPIKF